MTQRRSVRNFAQVSRTRRGDSEEHPSTNDPASTSFVRTMPANDLRSDKIWMDGTMVPYEEATVHVLTHSLHYGLAVFEGMRCYKCDDGHSAIFPAKEHIRRLVESGHIVEMAVPYSQEELLKACADVVRVNKFAECYLRPLGFFVEGEMGPSARGDKS